MREFCLQHLCLGLDGVEGGWTGLRGLEVSLMAFSLDTLGNFTAQLLHSSYSFKREIFTRKCLKIPHLLLRYLPSIAWEGNVKALKH